MQQFHDQLKLVFDDDEAVKDKDSPVNGTSANVGPAMSDRRGEREAFLVSSSPDRRSENRSKPPLGEQFFTVDAGLPRIRLANGWLRRPSKRVNVDHGQLVGRRLEDVPIVVRFHELARVCGRSVGWRERRRLESLTKMCENLADGPWIGDERNEPDVIALCQDRHLLSGTRQWRSRLECSRKQMLNSLLSLPAVVGEVFRNLDAPHFFPGGAERCN